MGFSYPVFSEPLDGKRWWMAFFESYNQRTDDLYYLIFVQESGTAVARFVAEVSVAWAGDDWTTPAFRRRLGEQLRSIADAGVSNTSYPGPMVPDPPKFANRNGLERLG